MKKLLPAYLADPKNVQSFLNFIQLALAEAL